MPVQDATEQAQAELAAVQYKLELIKEKARIQGEIVERQEKCDSIDAVIAQIDNGKYDNIPVIPIKRKRGRPKGSKNKKKDGVPSDAPKARAENSLRTVIAGILEKNKSGLELADLLRKARESGYQAKGKKDFPTQVLDTVKDLIRTPENGKSFLYDKEKKIYSIAA